MPRSSVPRPPVPRLPLLPAHPDGATLEVSVLCAASPTLTDAVRHPVTLTADWTVHTPHDLEAERVAAAFGGYSSCLVLVDRVAPALCALMQLRARRRPPALRRAARGSWAVRGSDQATCCRPAPAAADVAGHLRDAQHVQRSVDAPAALVAPLVDAVARAHHGTPVFRLSAAEAADLASCVRGPNGPAVVWDAGLHPDVVRAVHNSLVGDQGPPLPVALYLGILTRRPDLAWVAQTLVSLDQDDPGVATDGDAEALAEWLVATQTSLDRRDRRARAQWLQAGAPRDWILELSHAGYCAEDAARLAAATRRSAVGVAALLRAWVSAGCRPTADDLEALHGSGVPAWSTPSGPAIDRLASVLGDEVDMTRTDLGLLLAREGTVAAAAHRARAHHTLQRSCA